MKALFLIFFLTFWPLEEGLDVSRNGDFCIRSRDDIASNGKSLPDKVEGLEGLDVSKDKDFYVRDDEFVDTSNDKFFSIKIDALTGCYILSFNFGGTIDKYYLGRSY